jgi:hypothetical protein
MPENRKSKSRQYRKIIINATLLAIILCTAFSICAAFIGAENAHTFFNSIPLAVFWTIFALLIIFGFFAFIALRRNPALLLMHVGCLLIILGAMWGSQKAHDLRANFFNSDKIYKSRMIIYENSSDNRLFQADGKNFTKLPFSVRLNDFRIESYPTGSLKILLPKNTTLTLTAAKGETNYIPSLQLTIEILQTFKNFRLTLDGQNHITVDLNDSAENPALQIKITDANGSSETQYIFQKFASHSPGKTNLAFDYSLPVRQYVSSVDIIRKNKIVANGNIHVNKPLHYAGYHFYQTSYDQKDHRYTVLSVVSDSGLNTVYTGFILLLASLIWHFWIKKLPQLAKNTRLERQQNAN